MLLGRTSISSCSLQESNLQSRLGLSPVERPVGLGELSLDPEFLELIMWEAIEELDLDKIELLDDE